MKLLRILDKLTESCFGELIVGGFLFLMLWVGYRIGVPFWIAVLTACAAVIVGLAIHIFRRATKGSRQPKDAE